MSKRGTAAEEEEDGGGVVEGAEKWEEEDDGKVNLDNRSRKFAFYTFY